LPRQDIYLQQSQSANFSVSRMCQNSEVGTLQHGNTLQQCNSSLYNNYS
jgi:hypothetical protein